MQTELQRLTCQLQSEVDSFAWGGGPMSEREKLTDEALTYAKLGDLDECKRRLRLRDRPKFSSIEDCKARYAHAMAEKRGAAA